MHNRRMLRIRLKVPSYCFVEQRLCVDDRKNSTMKKLIIIFMLGLMAVSCGVISPQTFPQNQNFPLVNVVEIPSKDKIEKVAISDTWLAIQTQNNLTGLDIVTQKQLWSIPFSGDVTSKFSIVNDNLVAASNYQIVVVNKLGQKKVIDLGAIVVIDELISVNGNFLYIIRDQDWNLAVYDISKNLLLWKTAVGRGITDVFLDPVNGVVYVVTTESVRAFDNSSGTLLWQQERGAWHSVLNNGVLYLCEQTAQNYSYKLSAINVKNQQEIWSKTLSGDIGDIHSLSVINEMLTVGTIEGLIAIDKLNGNQIWQTAKDDIFYMSPIEFNGIIYAKGSSRKVYAISPNDGKILGYIQMEADTAFQSKYESLAGVFSLKDGVAFSTNASVFLFKTK